MRKRQIDDGLALALAGQVAVGVMPGDRQAERSHMALVIIGMMLKNAANSEAVNEALAMGERSRVQAVAGGWAVEEQTEIKPPLQPTRRER